MRRQTYSLNQFAAYFSYTPPDVRVNKRDVRITAARLDHVALVQGVGQSSGARNMERNDPAALVGQFQQRRREHVENPNIIRLLVTDEVPVRFVTDQAVGGDPPSDFGGGIIRRGQGHAETVFAVSLRTGETIGGVAVGLPVR